MKKIPYGISNFKKIREKNYLYVDKTHFIETLEDLDSYIFLIRPRRFGKSLFTETLKYYYDINSKNDFDNLFKDLYIGENSTGTQNSYMVLSFDFSTVETSKGMDELYKSFNKIVVNYVNYFIDYYKNIINLENLDQNQNTALDALMHVFKGVRQANQKLYIVIDEYDNFANDLLGSNNETLYKQIMQENGFVRSFYKSLKAETKTIIDRMFITGVSPMMLDDLTSGANMMSNYTISNVTNEIMGFTEEEVIGLIKEQGLDKQYPLDRLLYDMKINYNGYLFNEKAKNKLYNSDMVLYFLKQLRTEGEYPKDLIDDNIKTDYGKMRKLARIFDKSEKFKELILKESTSLDKIVTKIGVDNMFSEEHFISLLFYMGFLTIDNEVDEDILENAVVLKKPNYVIKKMYWDAFMDELAENDKINIKTIDTIKAISKMGRDGEIKDFLEIICNTLKQISNRNLQMFDEKYIKLLFLFHLGLSKMYIPTDEKEVDGGYIDILIEKGAYQGNVSYEWVVELKYVKVEDSKKEAYMEKVRTEGLKQLQTYMSSEYIQNKYKETNLKSGLLIFKGKDEYEWIENV